MCPFERYTQRRGRSGVPTTRVRTRRGIRRRCASRESFRTGSVATSFSFFPSSALPRKLAPDLSARLGGGARFSGLLLQALAGNANAFLLVRIGRPQTANIHEDLPNFSADRSRYGQVRLLFHRNLNALGNMKLHRMRIPQREADHFSLQLGAISAPDDIHFLLEPRRNARNGVGHQGARETMQRGLLVVLADGVQLRTFLLERNSSRQVHAHLALRPLHFDGTRRELNLHARGHGNRFSSNSRHSSMTPLPASRNFYEALTSPPTTLPPPHALFAPRAQSSRHSAWS